MGKVKNIHGIMSGKEGRPASGAKVGRCSESATSRFRCFEVRFLARFCGFSPCLGMLKLEIGEVCLISKIRINSCYQ